MWLPISILLLLGLAFGYRQSGRYSDDLVVLRHTISVNLSILKPELEELSALANQSQPSFKVERAKTLLSAAGAVVVATELRLTMASSKELGVLLEHVFAAMTQSTSARRLLNACVCSEASEI